MRYFISGLSVVAWALWFGGVIALFVFLVVLNHTFAAPRRELFAEAVTATFLVFERYQLVVGAVALVGAFGLRAGAAGRSRTIVFCLLALAAVAAITSAQVITPRIIQLRVQQADALRLDQPPDVAVVKEFNRMHGISGMVYTAQAALLLAAGALLPLAVQPHRASRQEV